MREQIVIRRLGERHGAKRRRGGRLGFGERRLDRTLGNKREPAHQPDGRDACRGGVSEALRRRAARKPPGREHRRLGSQAIAHAAREPIGEEPLLVHRVAHQMIEAPGVGGGAVAAQSLERLVGGRPLELAVHQCRNLLVHAATTCLCVLPPFVFTRPQ